MAVTDEQQHIRPLQVGGMALGVLAILCVLAMVGVFFYVGYFGAFDREYIQRADTVRVLSQNIAKNASEAANGKTDAFSLLESARDAMEVNVNILQNGNPETQLPPTEEISPEAHNALQQVIRPWEEIKGDVQLILERREMVITVNELAESFRFTVPRVQRLADQLVDRLSAANASRETVYTASLVQLYSEQVGRNIGEMLRGGIGNITAEQRLLNANDNMLDAVATLQDAGIRDGQARQLLADIAGLTDSMDAEVSEILERTADLFRVRDAADNIFVVSDQLLSTAEYLIGIYSNLEEQRPIKEVYGFILGGLALVLLVIRGFISRRIAVLEVASKESEKQALDEQTKRNQEAILNLLDEIEGLKEGDLTANASVGEEITGAIADAFNDAIDALRNLVTTINETSVQVSSAAQQTQATAMHLAEASDHQAHQITAASAAVNEMAVSIDQVSKNAEESAKVAQQSVDLALKGAETVRRTIEGMDAIREQIQETSKRIKRLGESSQEIGNIVELINDIADQTNILALNASIQAAMAGESGRGFAVVADEVQRLAERSGNATKQIEALVKTIQTDTNEAVISMEQSTAGVVQGARLAEDAGQALRDIESVSKQLAGLIQNISEAARQQANAAANISDTMNVIQEITSQTSAGTNETATSIGNLADLANDLRNSVAGFKLPE